MNSFLHQGRRVAVYCGSADGNDPAFLAEAVALGKAIAAAGLGLVYGGASVGLMGAVADAALAGGAEVIGVLPAVLNDREIGHRRLSRLERVPTMHQRKARMVELADAFLVLPGGYGTMEELLEAVTWAQLRLHAKPCILSTRPATGMVCSGFWIQPLRRGSLKRRTGNSYWWPGTRRTRSRWLVTADADSQMPEPLLVTGRKRASEQAAQLRRWIGRASKALRRAALPREA